MSIVTREWLLFNKATLIGHDHIGGTHDFSVAAEWTLDHVDHCEIGERRNAGNDWDRWDSIFMPSSSTFKLVSGMDEPCAFKVEIEAGLCYDDAGQTSFILIDGILIDPADPNAIDWSLVSGRLYNGMNNFGSYPCGKQIKGSNYQTVTIASLPQYYTLWFPPGPANTYRESLFRNGYVIYPSNWIPTDPSSWGNNKECRISIYPTLIRINYLNCIVNSISPMYVTTAAGQTIIFTGLGFDNSNADISGGWPWGGACDDRVDVIYMDGLQGQGTYTYNRTAGVPVAGQFRINSNSEIELVTSAMAEGSYEARMYKQNVKVGAAARTFHITDYAGDWQCEPDGTACHSKEGGGSRFNIRVSDVYVDKGFRAEKTPTLLFNWCFEDYNNNKNCKKWTQGTFRGTKGVYEDRIIQKSPIDISLDDLTGLPSFSEVEIIMANNDKAVSNLMANHKFKNIFVELDSHILNNPEGWKIPLMKMVGYDYRDMGDTWKFIISDISGLFIDSKIPKYIITANDYPDAHEDALTKPYPEVLGLHSLTGEEKGAIRAHCTNTVTHEYLAARCSLYSIDQVYSAGTLIDPVNYSVVYKDGGRTYIIFTSSQNNNEITFNCKGYVLAAWNSSNGFIQNPAYVVGAYLTAIAGAQLEQIDTAELDAAAAIFTANGWDKVGRWAAQDSQDWEEPLKELLYTFGIRMCPDNVGRFKMKKLDISNFSTTIKVFDQIDTIGHSERVANLRDAANFAKGLYDYYPNAGIFKGSVSDTKEVSVEHLKQRLEAKESPWRFPWTDSKTLVEQRLNDELLKLAYGNKKIEFKLSTKWASQLHVIDTFKHQDLFAPTIDGSGQSGHYYICQGISYDYDQETMDVIGEDIHWLLRQYAVRGTRGAHTELWVNAGPEDQMYRYDCDRVTGKFPDGQQGKMRIDRNLTS